MAGDTSADNTRAATDSSATAGRLFRRYRFILGLTYAGLFLTGLLVFRIILIDHENQVLELAEERLREHALLVDVLAKLTGDHVENLRLMVERDLALNNSVEAESFRTTLDGLQRRFPVIADAAIGLNQDGEFHMIVSGSGKMLEPARVRESVGPWANPARRLVWETLVAPEPQTDTEAGDSSPRDLATAIVVSAPVYRQNKMHGFVAVTLHLTHLTQVSDEFSYPLGKILLLDAKGRVLTQPVGHRFSTDDDALLAKSMSVPARRIVPVDDDLLFHQTLSFAPWSIVYLATNGDLQQIALAESSLLGLTIFLSMAVMFFISARLTRREFIDPAQALIAHIENRGELHQNLANTVPPAWHQWFERVSTVFTENAAVASLRQELEIASQMQASVLPRAFPARPDLTLTGRSVSAKEVGGDFYDYFFVDDHRIGVVIADVSGKGVPAALFMMISRTLNKALAVGGEAPAALLTQVNRLLTEENDAAMFVTLFYGVIDLRTGIMTYANGGHNPPAIVHDRTVTWLEEANGIALGALDEFTFEQTEIGLQPGCTLVLYTDGITEAFNSAGEEFGEERLKGFLERLGRQTPEQLADGLIAEVNRFAVGEEQADDITCLVLRFDGPAGQHVPARAELSERWQIKAELDNLPELIEKMTQFFQRARIDEESAGQVTLAVDELITNIISYGDNPDSAVVDIDVHSDGARLVTRIEDNGRAFDPFSVPVPDLEAEAESREIGGLGVHFVRELMDDYSYSHSGGRNCVILVKNLKQ